MAVVSPRSFCPRPVHQLARAVFITLFVRVTFAQGPEINCSDLMSAGAFIPYVLRNANGVEAHFIPFGAALQRLYVPDASGILRDVVLGFDDPINYCSWPRRMYFGAVVGECVVFRCCKWVLVWPIWGI